MMVRELLPSSGLLLHEDMSPLGGVLAGVGGERPGGYRGPPRPAHTSHAAHAHAGNPRAREPGLILRRRRSHMLLGPQHLLLLLLHHLRLVLTRYAGRHHACGVT